MENFEGEIVDVEKYTEESLYNWYVLNTNKAKLTSIIGWTTGKPVLKKLTELAKKLQMEYRSPNPTNILGFKKEYLNELKNLKAKGELPKPEISTTAEDIDIFEASLPVDQDVGKFEYDAKAIIDKGYKEGGAIEEKTVEWDEIPLDDVEFTTKEFDPIAGDFKPMEIVSGEDALVVKEWASYVFRGLGQAKQAIFDTMEKLGGETFIKASSEGVFIEADAVVSRSAVTVAASAVAADGLVMASAAEIFVAVASGIGYFIVIALLVVAFFAILEKLTGIDWSPIMELNFGTEQADKIMIKAMIESVKYGKSGVRVDGKRLETIRQNLWSMKNYIEKLNTFRKVLNRVYNCYYQLLDIVHTFEPELTEIKLGDYGKNHENNLFWIRDITLMKRLDDNLHYQAYGYRFQGKTTSPTRYNEKWTVADRKKWEVAVLRIIGDVIQNDNLLIAKELERRKAIHDEQDKRLVDTLLFENSIPINLVFWSLIWSVKAYTDPDTKMAEELLKGFAPFGQFDFDPKPQLTQPMDFITEEIVDSSIPIFNLFISATLAYSPHSNILFVACRGTDYNQISRIEQGNPIGIINFLHNALLDLNDETVPFEGINNHRFNIHHGFLKAFLSIKDRLLVRLKSYVNRYNPREVIFTGHSLGSAISKVCMIDKEISEYATAYIGFGSPRVSAGTYDKDVYRKRWGARSLRINNSDDIVSYLPFPFPPHNYKFMDKGLLIDRSNYKTKLLDGDFRYKNKSDYLDKLAGFSGHNRINYLDSICYLTIRRPVNIPKFQSEYPNILLSNNTREGLYLKSCAYKAFVGITKLNDPSVILNLLRLFSEFEKMDIDRDGNISRDEYNISLHPQRGRRLPEKNPFDLRLPSWSFDDVDFDGNNLISFKEYLKYSMMDITKDFNIIPVPTNPIITDIEDFIVNIEKLIILPPRDNFRESFIEYLTII